MVISFWRGTWILLDIHIHLFPPYATGVFGIIIHTCFVLMRQFIKDYFEEETERAKRDPIFVIIRRFYTYSYSVISVMQWRGCWTAFDHFFVERKDNVLTWTISGTLLSLCSLIVLKSLTNSLATPCILILDSLDACYEIPTRYRTMIILMLALSPTKENVIQIPQAKRADISSIINYNAHPFQNILKGHIPSAFSTASEETVTFVPRNIQDVIRNSKRQQQVVTAEENLIQQSQNTLPFPVNTYGQHDPFYIFKPQDISEVNLLATSNVRFAPPLWVDLNGEKEKKRILKHFQRNPLNGVTSHRIHLNTYTERSNR
ncbi:hypothetical protein Trydic_g12279 [Trypoxylus dichotomus]